MKVFVSSTCYDLVDIRAELECELREMGLEPILSDSSTSDFKMYPNRNSIDACLVNVRSSDVVLVLLSQRYGPSLKKSGFGDVSATHLEYQEAKTAGKPIYVYVRDRLWADYDHWVRNKCSDKVKLAWLQRKQDRPLLHFIKEHKKLIQRETKSNWMSSFRDSIELKRLISRDLQVTAGKVTLARLIQNNELPVIELSIKLAPSSRRESRLIQFTFKNIGSVTAFNLKGAKLKSLVLAPGQYTSFSEEWVHPSQELCIEYQTPQGHRIKDTYRLCISTYMEQQWHISDIVPIDCMLTDKRFFVASGFSPLKIEG